MHTIGMPRRKSACGTHVITRRHHHVTASKRSDKFISFLATCLSPQDPDSLQSSGIHHSAASPTRKRLALRYLLIPRDLTRSSSTSARVAIRSRTMARSTTAMTLLVALVALSAATGVSAALEMHGSGTSNPSKFFWKVMDILEERAKEPISMTYRSVGAFRARAAHKSARRVASFPSIVPRRSVTAIYIWSIVAHRLASRPLLFPTSRLRRWPERLHGQPQPLRLRRYSLRKR
jgi:hypothetical protein